VLESPIQIILAVFALPGDMGMDGTARTSPQSLKRPSSMSSGARVPRAMSKRWW